MPAPKDRNVGYAVKLLRAASGLSFAALAKLSNVSKPHIHHIETGAKTPSRVVVQSLDRALGARGLLVALDKEEDPLRRRALLAVIAASATGGNKHAQLLDSVGHAQLHRVGLSEVEAVRDSIGFCTSLDLRYGGGAVVGPGRAMLQWAVQLLDAHMAESVRAQLLSEVAALSDRVAWANYDAGNDINSKHLYGLALRLAREAEEPNLISHILIDASTRESHNGNHHEAASLLRLSLDDRRLLPTVRANVGLTYARHVANLGERGRALDAVSRSLELGTHVNRHIPSWSQGFLADPGHLESVASRSYLFAGSYEKAITGFTAALSKLNHTRGRGRAYALSLLGIAYFRAGYLDNANQNATDAIMAAQGLKSARVSGHLATLAGLFAGAHKLETARRLQCASREVSPA